MARLIDVKVPDLGDSKEVPIIELLVKEGERVEVDGVLLVLESDKATMEVPAPAAGVVRSLKLKLGDKLSKGDLICQLETSEAAAAAPAKAETPPAQPAAMKSAPPAAAKPAEPAAARLPVTVPEIGDYKDIPVIEVLVQEGDHVDKDTALLVLESDKATMEVPAPAAGTVRGFMVKLGDKLNPGDFICELEAASAAGAASAPIAAVPQSAAPVAAARSEPAPSPAPPPAASPAVAATGGGHAGPATRKFARELGVDLARVNGSGMKGRITIEDVQAHVKARMQSGTAAAGAGSGSGIPAIPAVDFAQFGPVERKELARIRKLSAAHLSRAWLNVPHVTQFDDADITELEAFRKTATEDTGVKLTLLPFLMKALAAAMKQFPEFNSSLSPEGDALILKGYCHLGFAADTPNGLVVPVVRDVWSKGIAQLAQECSELAKKARDGKLKPDEMRGGCMSISSLGGLGVSGAFTPIVNAPEVAILGVSKASMKPVWDGKVFQPRLMLPLSLSYDHRVIDGAYAARFTVALVKLLGDLRRLAL